MAAAAARRMKLDLFTQVVAPPRTTSAPPLAQAWAVGQVLSVTVVERVDANTLRLAINGQNLVAHTTLELPSGEQFTARVTAGGAQPQLSLIPTPSAESPADVVVSSLGRSLPQQAPLTEVIPSLLAPLQAPLKGTPLPPAVTVKLEALAASLPTLSQLAQPAGLARGIAATGTQLEARLAQVVALSSPNTETSRATPGIPVADLKWQLLALRETVSSVLQQASHEAAPRDAVKTLASPLAPLPNTVATAPPLDLEAPAQPNKAFSSAQNLAVPAPAIAGDITPETRAESLSQPSLPKLLDDINAGLARITTHQLNTASAAQNQQIFGYFEIPVRTPQGTDSVALEVQSEGHQRNAAGETALLIAVEVPIEGLGTLRARLALTGNRIACTTWSDTPQLRDLIAAHLRDLDAALTARGFEIAPSVMRQIDAPAPLRVGPAHLIDTQA